MSALNPKRDITIKGSIATINDAVKQIVANFPGDYKIESENDMLNHIKVQKKMQLLDPGYYIDLFSGTIDAENTKVSIEVSRRMGAINTAAEQQISSKVFSDFIDRIGAALNGTIGEEAAKEEAKQKAIGMMLWYILGGILIAFAFWYFVVRK